MRLLEFQASNIHVHPLIDALGRVFDMERVGGPARIYDVKGQQGIIFLLNNSLRGIGIIWKKGSTVVQSIGVWKTIDFDRQPDVIVDMPAEASIEDVIVPLSRFIKRPHIGLIESLQDSHREVSVEEFIRLARNLFHEKAKMLDDAAIGEIENHFSVRMPSSIRTDPRFKVDATHLDLYDIPEEKVLDLKGANKFVLMGRKPDGQFFSIPGIDITAEKIEQLMHREEDTADGSGLSMEEQYHALDQKVRLVAGGNTEGAVASHFVKSLLITGAPSAGKTFRVMTTIKKLGLKEGEDYVVKKGRITAKSMFRVLIEQINGLVIFDDCDSVVEDKNGINMLKGALDTDPVREVSYDVHTALNTAVMPQARRDEVVNAMSRTLRNVPTLADVNLIKSMMPKPKTAVGKKAETEPVKRHWMDELVNGADDDEMASHDELRDIQQFVLAHLPNKIDFAGRIIFISNMRADEWDSAILTRAFHQNMEFPDEDMLNYIETIKDHIDAPRLSSQDKQEVIDYIRQLWKAGKINRPINFRLIQQAFDLRLLNDWKSIIASIG